MTVHVNYSVYIFLHFCSFSQDLNGIVQNIWGYVYRELMLVYKFLLFLLLVSIFFACDCVAWQVHMANSLHVYIGITHAYNFGIYDSMLLTARITGNELLCAVCLTEQTWAELSIHGHADRSLDGLIINLLFPLFPASDGLCDWNNTMVIFVFRVIRQLSYSHASLTVAWTDLPSLSGSFDILD